MSICIDPAAEHINAPTMKTTEVMSSIFLRPYRSERLPPVMASTAAPTRTELTASSCWKMDSPKLCLMKISAPDITPVSYPNSKPPIAAKIAAI
jgi:hypothetical protein